MKIQHFVVVLYTQEATGSSPVSPIRFGGSVRRKGDKSKFSAPLFLGKKWGWLFYLGHKFSIDYCAETRKKRTQKG